MKARSPILLQACLKLIRHAPPSGVNSSPERLLQMYQAGAGIGHSSDTDAGRLVAHWLWGDTLELLKTVDAIATRQPS